MRHPTAAANDVIAADPAHEIGGVPLQDLPPAPPSARRHVCPRCKAALTITIVPVEEGGR